MKKVFGVLAFLSFFYLLGVVGAVEQDTMALGTGMVRMGIGLGCFWLFCELSGAFYPAPLSCTVFRSRSKEKAADGTGTSINGKRKSSI